MAYLSQQLFIPNFCFQLSVPDSWVVNILLTERERERERGGGSVHNRKLIFRKGGQSRVLKFENKLFLFILGGRVKINSPGVFFS
jgi:hypothetical protein